MHKTGKESVKVKEEAQKNEEGRFRKRKKNYMDNIQRNKNQIRRIFWAYR